MAYAYIPIYLPADIQQAGVVEGSLNFAVFVLFAMALSFIFTWVFNNTKGSLLFAILLHGSVDGTETYIQTLADRHLLSAIAAANIFPQGLALGSIVLALLLIVVTRGRLSYRHYQREAESLDLPASAEERIEPAGT